MRRKKKINSQVFEVQKLLLKISIKLQKCTEFKLLH